MKPWFYSLIACLYRVFCALVHPVRIEGAQNVPDDGPVILCANHKSAQDPFVVAAYLRRKVRFIAKKELFNNRIVGALAASVGAFPVARGENDISAIRTSLAVLKDGGVLGIFPEGHRYHDGQMHRAENGVSLIALRSKAAVIPAYIDGNYRMFKRITVTYGNPVDLSDFYGKMDAQTLSLATDKIFGAMLELAEKDRK